MSRERDLTVETEAAWVAFRGRLADHVAAMVDGDVLVAEYAEASPYDDDPDVVLPYVQLVGYGDGWVRCEAVGNAYLDGFLALDDDQEVALLDLGWTAPREDDESDNFHHHAPCRDADRVAVLLVSTLREVFGVLHPVFLAAGGLEHDPDAPVVEPDCTLAHDVEPSVEPSVEPGDLEPDDTVTFPHGRDHLQQLVDDAMTEVFPELQHDDDGDVPIVAGQSMVFVRVLSDRPAVEVYAEIALGVEDLDRLDLELGLLNRAHPWWKFVAAGDLVQMRHEVVAMPFSGHLLRVVVARFVDEVDALARDLVARVGGRRFNDVVPGCEWEGAGDADADEEPDLAMAGLLELCHLGAPRATTVAGLFHGDRDEVVRQIVAVRTGLIDCDGHDVEVVLTVLRKALRHLADQWPRPLPPKPRRVDDHDGDDTRDLGRTA